MKTPQAIQDKAKKCVGELDEGIGLVQQYLAQLTRAENEAGKDEEKLRKLQEARTLLLAWESRFEAAKLIADCKAFAMYGVDNDLLIVQPNEYSAALIAKAEEVGARITKYGEFGDPRKAEVGKNA